MSEREIFDKALSIANREERSRYLDEVCANNERLRGHIEGLLSAHEDLGSFLQSPPVAGASPTIDRPPLEKPGTQIGPYKLLQQIGEGGMGVVYMAEQKEPVERRVALKIIKPGMDTRQVIARFEAEEQALAMMDHPSIAKVLDAGVTDSGRPYFVMELIHGIPVTQFCDEQHLTARERLELFIPICQAVQHAHQKGIIHRDIKPGNILVALYDGRPVPRVIDFGVAKATGGRLTEETMLTGLGQIVGTIEYMSPEQAQRNQLDIDTRSDVYSLGVVLYELLTGDTPFDKQRLHAAALDELLRIIREEEPPKPSTKLSHSDTLPSVAANRKIEPAKLSALIRGELDWIVMKALEKDRGRRYETATAFAADVQHHLHDEPVSACPPSTTYRFRKFARRNKIALLASGTVAAVLVLGSLGIAWQAVRATRAERLARTSEQRALEDERKAIASEQKASEEAATARAINAFLQQDLLGLAGAAAQLHADMEPDPNLKLTTLLDRAAAKVDERFDDRPLLRAAVQTTLACAYESIGRYAEAVRLWEEVRQYRETTLGREHVDTLAAMLSLAQACTWSGRYLKARDLAQQTLELQRKVLGPEHRETLKGMHVLASVLAALGRHAEAAKLRETTLAVRKAKLPSDHPDVLSSMHNLANSYAELGRRDDALSLREEILMLRKKTSGPNHPDTLKSMTALAGSYFEVGRCAEALKLLEENVALCKATLGADHPDTLSAMYDLAIWHKDFGQRADALQRLEEVLKLQKAKLGPDHPRTLQSMFAVAVCYSHLGRYADALKLHEEVLAMRKATLGPDHPDTFRSRGGVAHALYYLGRYAEALQLYQQVLAWRTATLGPDHPDTLGSLGNMASCYSALGRHADALKLHEEGLALTRANLGPDHPDTLLNMGNVAICYGNLKRHAEALELNEETLALKRAKLDPNHPDTLTTMYRLACSYGAVDRHADAQKLHEEVLTLRKATLGPDHPDTLTSMSSVAGCYYRLGRHADALKLNKEILAFRESTLGPDHPLTLWAMVNVATSLDRLNRGAEAAPVIDECLKRAVGKPVPPSLFNTMILVRAGRADRTKDAAGWWAMAEMFEKLQPPDPESRYNLACLRAIIAAILRAVDKSEAANDATAEADRAMAWLKQAVAAGFKNINLLKTDNDLDALRDRDDFKALLAELAASIEEQKQ